MENESSFLGPGGTTSTSEPQPSKFRALVVGDVENVLFSYAESSHEPKHSSTVAREVGVISGAPLVCRALGRLLPDAYVELGQLPPKSSNAVDVRVTLRKFKNEKEKEVFRISQYIDNENSDSLVGRADTLAKVIEYLNEVSAAPNAISPDVLVVHGIAWAEREERSASNSNAKRSLGSQTAKETAIRLLELVFANESSGARCSSESPPSLATTRVLVNLNNDLPIVRFPTNPIRNLKDRQERSEREGSSGLDLRTDCENPVLRVPEFDNPLMQELHSRYRSQVGIVTSLSSLRRESAMINHTLSWEQTLEDFGGELTYLPTLRALSRFRHLFVRVGLEGVIHIQNVDNELSGAFYFWPHGKAELHRDGATDGWTLGKNTILVAALLRECAAGLPHTSNRAAPTTSNWLKAALHAMKDADTGGYGTKVSSDESMIQTLFDTAKAVLDRGAERTETLPSVDEQEGEKVGKRSSDVMCRAIPRHLLQDQDPGVLRDPRRWRILDDALQEAPVHRINVAMAIVRAGHKNVLNLPWRHRVATPGRRGSDQAEVWKSLTRVEYWNPQDRAPDFLTLQGGDYPAVPEPYSRDPVNVPILGNVCDEFSLGVPIVEFDKLIVAERDEIETFRSIGNLVRQYVRSAQSNERPVSIAVFGPPGSGKSFAVKQIANTIDQGKSIQQMEYNVAQFRTPEDLGVALSAVGSASHEKTPLVFFDEFDCALGGKQLGWLQYFLAPMQDGAFYSTTHQKIEIGRAIFVFAGGVNASFENFDPRTRVPDERLGNQITDDHRSRVRLFSEQKGPDFISRLRGHINILEVNQEPGRVKHLIRRALQLRGIIEMLKYTRPDRHGLAAVDEEVIYALLTIDRYRHGVRSMEAILRMCTRFDDWLSVASLPARAQLNMHVDAEEFMRRVYRGRLRVKQDRYQFGVVEHLCEDRNPPQAEARADGQGQGGAS